MSIFEWPLTTGFTVTKKPILAASSCTLMRICVHVGTPLVLKHTTNGTKFGILSIASMWKIRIFNKTANYDYEYCVVVFLCVENPQLWREMRPTI